jgi:hypothetical protein
VPIDLGMEKLSPEEEKVVKKGWQEARMAQE